ncbi:MAG: hypothetical protein ACE5OZ_23185 [Candidatus Heimdallarchaeota archaeon]
MNKVESLFGDEREIFQKKEQALRYWLAENTFHLLFGWKTARDYLLQDWLYEIRQKVLKLLETTQEDLISAERGNPGARELNRWLCAFLVASEDMHLFTLAMIENSRFPHWRSDAREARTKARASLDSWREKELSKRSAKALNDLRTHCCSKHPKQASFWVLRCQESNENSEEIVIKLH